MKKDVNIAAMNIVSPLGFTTAENFACLKEMKTGLRKINDAGVYQQTVCAALLDREKLNAEFLKIGKPDEYTFLERMFLLSINNALSEVPEIDPGSKRTLFILSSTKGNIDLLDNPSHPFGDQRKYLWKTAGIISRYFGNPNPALLVSNACISGAMAIILGKRLLETGAYDHIVVSGGDIIGNFVISGFESFKAISPEICKPYDAERDGISLGEGAATLVLTRDPVLLNKHSRIRISGGASSNDANHISGPSRNGDGLLLAIRNAMKEAGLTAADIDYISGHGTATEYNDEMEARAMAAGKLSEVPINSLKSYFGHTLGAAGLLESVVAVCSMLEDTLIATYNYKTPGVSVPLAVIRETTHKKINRCLKTSAGFGGCNAAILFEKI